MSGSAAPRRGAAWLVLALPALLSVAVYLPTVQVGFVLDDLGGIVDNPRLSGARSLWAGLGHASRPLTEVLLWATHRAAGLDPWAYHVFGALLHGVCVLLAGLVLVRLLEDANVQGPDARWAAAGGAACFGLHPLQSESVIYAIQAYSVLPAAALGLSALLLGRAFLLRGGRGAAAGALAAAALAGLARQDAVMVPLALLGWRALLLRPGAGSRPGRNWCFLGALAVAAVLPVAVTVARSAEGLRAAGAGFGLPEMGAGQYLATQAVVLWRYLGLIAWPAGQTLEHAVPSYAPGSWPVVLGAGGLLLWVAALVLVSRRRPLVTLGGAWFLLWLAPTSSFFPLRDVMFEHRLYLALLGVVVAGLGLTAPWWRGRGRGGALLAAGAVSVVLGGLTLARGQVWVDPLALWADAAEKAPGRARPWNNLGVQKLERGRPDEALADFARALEAEPAYHLSHYNRGLAWYAKGRFAESAAAYRRALALAPEKAVYHNNLGNALASLGDLAGAEAEFRAALALAPRDPDALGNLGLALLGQGQPEAALAWFEAALVQAPGHPVAREGLARARRRLAGRP